MLSIAWFCLPAFGAQAKPAGPPPHLSTDEAGEVSYLVATGSADSLATASLLAHLVETEGESDVRPDPTPMIRRAVALAPERPELLWLQLRDCELRQCVDEKRFTELARAVDPDNGLLMLPELNPMRGASAADTTRIIGLIASAKTMNLYWNKLLVMMFDAMTHGRNAPPATAITFEADDRLSHATGVLTAIDLPPFKPIVTACASDQFAEPGRRAACESLMVRLDASDSMIAQSLSVSVQQKWGSPGSERYKGMQQRRLQQHYLVQASSRVRGSRVNQDADTRVGFMRRLATEEEVDKAVLVSFHEPVERPANWQSPTGVE